MPCQSYVEMAMIGVPTARGQQARQLASTDVYELPNQTQVAVVFNTTNRY